jgi:hypothetical protein
LEQQNNIKIDQSTRSARSQKKHTITNSGVGKKVSKIQTMSYVLVSQKEDLQKEIQVKKY